MTLGTLACLAVATILTVIPMIGIEVGPLEKSVLGAGMTLLLDGRRAAGRPGFHSTRHVRVLALGGVSLSVTAFQVFIFAATLVVLTPRRCSRR